MASSRIAFLTPYWPFPANTGGKIRSSEIIQALAKDHELHLIFVHGSPESTGIELLRTRNVRGVQFTSNKQDARPDSTLLDHAIERWSNTPVVPRLDVSRVLARLARIRYIRRSLLGRIFNHLATTQLARSLSLAKFLNFSRRALRNMSLIPNHVSTFMDASILDQVKEYLLAVPFDVIFVDEIVMVPYIQGGIGGAKILALQNIDYLLRLQMISQLPRIRPKLEALWEYYRLKLFTRSVLRRHWDAIIVCSINDEKVVKEIAPRTETYVVPNGVDLNYYAPQRVTKMRVPTLLFVGTLFYPPNVDAVLYFFDGIFPRIRERLPSVRVQIVGHNPPPAITQLSERFPEVLVTGSVPDVRPYFARSTIQIVPLRIGGGTSLKIVQGLAMGCPTVSTSVGCRGLNLRAGQDLLVADDPDTFADAVVALALDGAYRRKLIASGKKSVKQYAWFRLTSKVIEVCDAIGGNVQASGS